MAALSVGTEWRQRVTSRRRCAVLSAAAAVGALSAAHSYVFNSGAFVPPPAVSGHRAAGALPGAAVEAAATGETLRPSAAAAAVAMGAAAAIAASGARGGAATLRGNRVKAAAGSDADVAVAEPEAAVAEEEVPEVAMAGGAAVVAEPESNWGMFGRRMWTKADSYHVHAISGTVHTVIGLAYLLDVVASDVAKLNGGTYDGPHVPIDVVLFSMLAGAVNALSGLQASLLPRPFKDFLQLMGFGENGNLKSAGFVNTAMFYFFLTYQSLRVLPEYPTFLMPLDGPIAALTLASIWHAIYIINSWVGRGKLSQGFAIGMSAPLMLNVPVSLHLLFEGQSWVEALTAAYSGWPEVFFAANYALAWAGSMVTLILSIYERKVCSITDRLLMTLALGLVCFTVIPLHGYLYVPQWFNGDQMVMLTLTPP